jgi:hypothetical protein
MDFSSYGWEKAIVKFFKIIGWYALSGAATALVAYFASFKPSSGEYLAVLAVMGANAILAGIGKWLSIHKPIE